MRIATLHDLPAVGRVYNEGIEDRVATLDVDAKSGAEMLEWFARHDERYAVIVAESAGAIAGWASLNRYSQRAAYDGVADLSVYVARAFRGRGIGTALLQSVEAHARAGGFHKIVLFTLAFNEAGQRLYRRAGFREVGVFQNQGRLDGRFVDVLAMEKSLAGPAQSAGPA